MTAIAEGLTLDETALAELQAGLRGQIVGRDDPTYDEHRKIWNGSIDRRPALIARCAGVADVMSAVKFARRHGLRVAVRSGGHSFPGLSIADDAFVIDLSPMKGVRVDPQERTARVQAGVLLGELDRETQPFGLAAPSGIVTHTGVAGLTLGGGIGWIMRKHGLSVDQLRRVDLVTADGDLDEGEKFIGPMREFGTKVADVCAPKPFLTHQSMFDPSFVPGRWYYFRAFDIPALTDEMIDITVEHSLRIKSPLTSFPIWQMGGAVARVGEDETAFNGRNAGFTYNIGAATATGEGFDEEREWVRSFWSALEPHFTTVYVNFLMDEGEDRVKQAYGTEKYDRLKALKRKYDPENFFRINQNISPT